MQGFLDLKLKSIYDSPDIKMYIGDRKRNE
ncbi:hypothetical protein SDC9_10381 [bioreactor metagenome]|uniref:Uncharacterized protein n=1 Tax=bioreactor metagenome TaxID=1076179 RepID=A0A644TG09_9ZZZZ